MVSRYGFTTSAGAVYACLAASILSGGAAFSVLPSWPYVRTEQRLGTAHITCKDPLHRRDILLSSVGGIVGPQLTSLQQRFSSPATKSLSTMSAAGGQNPSLRVCVVGAGSISREFALYHFGPATQTVVTSVVDLDEDRARRLAADVGSVQAGATVSNRGAGGKYSAAATETRGKPVPFSTQLAPCLDGCDVVYVGTTPNSHANLVLEALEAGKSVLLEKPLAARPEDADAIVEAAERAARRGQVVGMDIGMRWNPALHQLRRRAVLEGELGAISSARLTLAFTQWPREWQVQAWCAGRAEGGPLREVGTHFFFGMMELFGEECVGRVRAEVDYSDGAGGSRAEVRAQGMMELGKQAGSLAGLQIALDVRTDSSVGDVYELELVGEKGSLMLKDFAQLKRTAPVEAWVVEKGSYGRVESVTSLVDAIGGGGGGGLQRVSGERAGQVITARQGRNAQRLLDAIVASNGEWVQVRYD